MCVFSDAQNNSCGSAKLQITELRTKKYAMLCALMHAALRFETWSHNLLRSQALMCCPVSCTNSMLICLFVLVTTDLPAGRVHGWWRKLVMWIHWSQVASSWRLRGCILNRKHPRMMRCWNCMVVKHDAQTPIRVGRIVFFQTGSEKRKQKPLTGFHGENKWLGIPRELLFF